MNYHGGNNPHYLCGRAYHHPLFRQGRRADLYRQCAASGLTTTAAAWIAGISMRSMSKWAAANGVKFRRAKAPKNRIGSNHG